MVNGYSRHPVDRLEECVEPEHRPARPWTVVAGGAGGRPQTGRDCAMASPIR
jgi:hypothetical protein